MNYLRNIFLNKSMHCRIYESLKVLGIRIRSLELYLRTPLRTSFFSLRDVILNHRISAYYNTKSKVEKLWRAFRRRRSKIVITHFRITSNSTENMVSSRKDLKLLCNPSCGAQNMTVLRHILTAAPSSPRCICHRQRSATKPGTRVPRTNFV